MTDPYAPPPSDEQPAPPPFGSMPSAQPPYAPPPYGPPSYGQPSYGAPAYGQPAYGPQPTGYPGGYGYPPAYGYPPVAQRNGKATAGLVLGIVGLVLAWLPFFDAPLWILALIFSILGLSEARNRGAEGRGRAKAGLILAIIATVVSIAWSVTVIVLAVNSNSDCADQYGVGTSQYDDCVNN